MKLTDEQKQACLGAADYIAEHGWYQGSYYWPAYDADGRLLGMDEIAASGDVNPPACVLGAIAKVSREKPESIRMRYGTLLWALLPEEERLDRWGAIQHWNDQPTTTAEEVILKLKEWGSS